MSEIISKVSNDFSSLGIPISKYAVFPVAILFIKNDNFEEAKKVLFNEYELRYLKGNPIKNNRFSY